ncbi:aminoglycoside 6-adenylyltransferase [Cohnella abietis]|uniref:Aminoglycoside 6-adenylyltransferase n=1 Tax=Cohnella abietis TaxID=2507935 RepID=A0A3T1CZ03_9BACL|nr:aminoglycoside 6-adenylyltransferase [Cohnella abietis]BBI31041.1 aminoglycoside 6-adenylyltransferase [Cohnella abietis]
MRNEQEILSQLLDYAQSHPQVKVVLHNGSRVNPKVTKDILCDYDLIFGVIGDVFSFVQNQQWIKQFGHIMIMQQNNLQEGTEEWAIFLMLFNDGVRIDLTFRNVKHILDPSDSLTKILLDKDNLMGAVEPASDKSYITCKPTKQQYDEVLNEIWWCSTNVAKGLWRDELPYAKYMLDVVVRDALISLLSWYAGMNNDWNINTGKAGRWLKKYLPEELWDRYISTYAGSDFDQNWAALEKTGALTRIVGTAVADSLGYQYPQAEDEKVTKYLAQLRKMEK